MWPCQESVRMSLLKALRGWKNTKTKMGSIQGQTTANRQRDLWCCSKSKPQQKRGKTEMMARFKSQCDQKPLCSVNLLLLFVCRFSEGAQVIVRSSIRVNAGWRFLHVRKKIVSKIHMLKAKTIWGITKKIMIPTRLESYVASVTMVYLGMGLNSTSRVLEMWWLKTNLEKFNAFVIILI